MESHSTWTVLGRPPSQTRFWEHWEIWGQCLPMASGWIFPWGGGTLAPVLAVLPVLPRFSTPATYRQVGKEI